MGLEQSGSRGFCVAFYGGTFTGLPDVWQRRFLTAVHPYRDSGLISHVRCSTRPDQIFADHLRWLQELGLNMIELGIQSFDQRVLQASGRGYDSATAEKACKLVRDSGLQLGIQLMPGLPESTMQSWLHDVRQTCSFCPETVRIYPCLVLQDTLLARIFHAGSYRPWSLSFTIWAISQALLQLWKFQIPVARIGLAPEQDLESSILGGPWHPALGYLAKSHALRGHILHYLSSLPEVPLHLYIPKRYASEFWGHGGEQARTWSRRGLNSSRVRTWEHSFFMFTEAGPLVAAASAGVAACHRLHGQSKKCPCNTLTPPHPLCKETNSTVDYN
ncbi:radical SAM protein [Desulfonatronum parangueonense]